ncbi:hypothetical protein DLAC_10206 [Tieghemostelium lacteum]|uniref:NGG1p interacting factor NIF3 n=1 Tax=Tieghemostelium lacteum TaxID=361077 RepID=A0A151Z4V4_TIELA|nr:hypothetical protein DLAC_10206 [Tieghemostelium lacteum]|eukprot:KYQ88990.1 hypothetical protein DLAC_10206 [Tieghemostelium lacteum]
MYKLCFFVPKTHVENVKNAIFQAGGGVLGNYDRCCWQTLGIGQFRALKGSNPFIGDIGTTETVEEYKVEMVVETQSIKHVISALKQSHPYETPAFEYWRINEPLI